MKLSIFKTMLIVIAVISLTAVQLYGQTPEVSWIKNYGGGGYEECYSVWQTADGGYVLGGKTSSFGSGSDDMWLVKIDPWGNIQWHHTYGFNGSSECCRSVQQTTDGGYILGGYTYASSGPKDMYLVKTDSLGNLQWQQTFGGIGPEYCYSVQQTTDGGYILGGETNSLSAHSMQVYLVKTDTLGNLQWQKTFGTSGNEQCFSVQQTSDGGYILTTVHGNYSLLKTNSQGDLVWYKTFTFSSFNYAVQQTTDGGYVLAGWVPRASNSPPYNVPDASLIKTDAAGNLVWQRSFGGTNTDYMRSVQQTSDGGYILGGQSYTPANAAEMYVVKTDPLGNSEWQMTFGDWHTEGCYSVKQTSNGGYILGGVTCYYPGYLMDMYVVRLGGEPPPHGTISGTTTPAIAGITIELHDNNNAFLSSTLTSAAGSYSFPDVEPGNYFVDLVVPPGYEVETNHVPVTVLPGQSITVDFYMSLMPGTIQGHVSPAYVSSTIDLFDASNLLVASVQTAGDGSYSFPELNPANYSVEVIVPLGFSADTNHVPVALAGGETDTVNFTLTPTITMNDARSKGYWKHEVDANITNNGNNNTDYTAAGLVVFSQDIFDRFHENPYNPIQVQSVTYIYADTSAVPLCMFDLQYTLNINQGGSTMYERACQQYLTLLLNVVSYKIAQYMPASADGATVSQAIVYINNLLSTNNSLAKQIAETLNEGQTVGAGVIPLTTPYIYF